MNISVEDPPGMAILLPKECTNLVGRLSDLLLNSLDVLNGRSALLRTSPELKGLNFLERDPDPPYIPTISQGDAPLWIPTWSARLSRVTLAFKHPRFRLQHLFGQVNVSACINGFQLCIGITH